jgi:hypothetical protein
MAGGTDATVAATGAAKATNGKKIIPAGDTEAGLGDTPATELIRSGGGTQDGAGIMMTMTAGIIAEAGSIAVTTTEGGFHNTELFRDA